MVEPTKRTLTAPFWPVPARTPEGLNRWANDITFALNSAFIDLVTRIEDLTDAGSTQRFGYMQAKGTRKFFFEEGTTDLFFDAPGGTWERVGSADMVQSFFAAEEPTGFLDTTSSSIAFSNATRTLTLTPVTDPLTVYLKGRPIEITGAKTKQITDTQGTWHFYIDSSGTLQASQSVQLADLIIDYVYVALVYWDATNNVAVVFCDERHGLMPHQVHIWLHLFQGTQHGGGLGLTNITPDGDGSSNTHVQMGVQSGSIVDEDLWHTITTKTFPATIPVLAKTGATPNWYIAAQVAAPIVLSGGIPQYNSYTLGSWGQTPVTNTKYFLMHIFATNDSRAANSIVAIQGENEYNNVNDARDGATQEIADLITTGLPMPEFLPIGTVIFQHNTAYTNDYNARIVSTADGDPYVSWLGTEITPGSAPGSHPNLTNRALPAQHPATAISFGSTNAITEDIYLAGTKNLRMQNGRIYWDDSGYIYADNGTGAFGTLIGAASSVLNLGQLAGGQYRTVINSKDYISLTADAVLDNNKALKGFNAAGATSYNLALVNASDEVELGSSSLNLNIMGTQIDAVPPLANTVALRAEESGGTARNVAMINASNEVELGNTSDVARIKCTKLYIDNSVELASGKIIAFNAGYIYANDGSLYSALMAFGLTRFTFGSTNFETYIPQDMTLANNIALDAYNAAETTTYNLAKMNSSNEIEIGASGIVMNLLGSRFDTIPALANNVALAAEESGGTERNVVKMNTSNVLEVGNANNACHLIGNPTRWGDYGGGNYSEAQTDGDLIQTGTPIIQNATRVQSPEFRGKLWRTTQSKTLTDAGSYNLFQWDSATTQSAGFMIMYQVEVVYTQTTNTHYLIETGMICASMVNKSGTVTVGVGSKVGNVQCNTGTGVMSVTFGSGTGTNYGRVSINADLTTGTWVSGEVRYMVMNTDIDNNALSLFG